MPGLAMQIISSWHCQLWRSPSSGQPVCSIASKRTLRLGIWLISVFWFQQDRNIECLGYRRLGATKTLVQPKSGSRDVASLVDPFPRVEPSFSYSKDARSTTLTMTFQRSSQNSLYPSNKRFEWFYSESVPECQKKWATRLTYINYENGR